MILKEKILIITILRSTNKNYKKIKEKNKSNEIRNLRIFFSTVLLPHNLKAICVKLNFSIIFLQFWLVLYYFLQIKFNF